MSEFTPPGHELKQHDQTAESYKQAQEQSSEENLKPEETPKINIEEVRHKVLELEQDENPLELQLDKSPEVDQPIYIDRTMKIASLNNELKLIRAKLTSGQRLFSKSIHQPAIRRISDVSARTITRPSGLLGGGVLAFCGSLIYLLFSKYIGLRYNYFIFIMLFVIGYLLATIIEFVLKASRTTKGR